MLIEKPEIPLDSVKFERSEGREGELLQVKCGRITLLSDHVVIGEELLNLLNNSIHHDGSWRVVWCKPSQKPYRDPFAKKGINLRMFVATECEMHWLDRDGDPQLVVYSDDKPWVMIEKGLTYYRDVAEEAWARVYDMKKSIDIKPEQTFKQAQGQTPTGVYQDAPDVVLQRYLPFC